MAKFISDDVKEQIRVYYKSRPMTMQELSDKFGYCIPTLMKILGDIPRWPKSKIFNPTLNDDFFRCIDTEAKAYFLGLMISDGNVFKANDNRASISITLDQGDAYILDFWKECLNSSTELGHDGRGCVQYAVRSLDMANDLAKYGVIPRKTLYSYLPTIEDKAQMRHLIRGLVDGDGGIYAYLDKNDPRHRYKHSITLCGTQRLMEEVVDFLDSELHLKTRVKVYTCKDRPLSMMRISNVRDMNAWGDWMYSGATLYLKRKYNSFLDFQNHYGIANTEVGFQITTRLEGTVTRRG